MDRFSFRSLSLKIGVASGCHVVYSGVDMKQRTNIYLRPDQMKQLKALNKETGAPVAELVRRAVDEYLAKRAKEMK